MPTKPLKTCVKPGCPNLTSGRLCVQHKQKEQQRYDQQRGSAADRGYDARWRRESKRFLRLNPLCAICQLEGRLNPASVVDHKVPHKGNYDLFWDQSNWQPLCKRCHDIKTAKEDGRWG